MANYQSPFPLPDEHLRLVGIIAAHWEHLDLILQRAVAEIMSLDWNRVRLLTENLSVTAKLDLLSAHARQALQKNDLTRFNKVIALVQAAYGRRNAYVHAKWDQNGAEPEQPWQFSIRTRGGKLSIVQKPTPIEELEKAAAQIWSAGESFGDKLRRYGMLQA
jgi:hypothetical protein